MTQKSILSGTTHRLPSDMQKVFLADADSLEAWNSLTPLARNEWICWVTIVKKAETRQEHLIRLGEDLRKGKRRPCCWPGCPHHNPKAGKWLPNSAIKRARPKSQSRNSLKSTKVTVVRKK